MDINIGSSQAVRSRSGWPPGQPHWPGWSTMIAIEPIGDIPRPISSSFLPCFITPRANPGHVPAAIHARVNCPGCQSNEPAHTEYTRSGRRTGERQAARLPAPIFPSVFSPGSTLLRCLMTTAPLMALGPWYIVILPRPCPCRLRRVPPAAPRTVETNKL